MVNDNEKHKAEIAAVVEEIAENASKTRPLTSQELKVISRHLFSMAGYNFASQNRQWIREKTNLTQGKFALVRVLYVLPMLFSGVLVRFFTDQAYGYFIWIFGFFIIMLGMAYPVTVLLNKIGYLKINNSYTHIID